MEDWALGPQETDGGEEFDKEKPGIARQKDIRWYILSRSCLHKYSMSSVFSLWIDLFLSITRSKVHEFLYVTL